MTAVGRGSRVLALGLLGGLLLGGCQRPAPFARNSVAGVARLGSTPLTDGIVTLHGPDGATAAGAILPDGRYTIDDPPLGLCQATVTPSPGFTSPGASAADDSHAPPDARRSPIPPRFHKPGNGLSVDVKPGVTNYDIVLN